MGIGELKLRGENCFHNIQFFYYLFMLDTGNGMYCKKSYYYKSVTLIIPYSFFVISLKLSP